MYLLDTNHCSRIINGDHLLLQRLEEHAGALITTSVVSRGELIFMAEKSENTALVESFLQGIHTISINPETATIYGQIKHALLDIYGPKERAKRRKITTNDLGFGENDIWIAAMSLQHRYVLVSSDADFPRIHNAVPLALEFWWMPVS